MVTIVKSDVPAGYILWESRSTDTYWIPGAPPDDDPEEPPADAQRILVHRGPDGPAPGNERHARIWAGVQARMDDTTLPRNTHLVKDRTDIATVAVPVALDGREAIAAYLVSHGIPPINVAGMLDIKLATVKQYVANVTHATR